MDKEEAINRIVAVCNQDNHMIISTAYGDGGIDPLFPRLSRAAMNQLDGGQATFSRYAIWANTVRDNVRFAIDLMGEGKQDQASSYLIRSINSLSAFAEIQALCDPMEMGSPSILDTNEHSDNKNKS